MAYRAWVAFTAALVWVEQVPAWNSHYGEDQLYSFQDFYTDAQYGPDFGYYSTGRILHADGPADNGITGGSQEWFNSYTTLPMSLSPHFAHALCDRLVTMWLAMGSPDSFVIAEFGGGTGMLARDILRYSRDRHGEFHAALSRYVIAERSQAMRTTQNRTAAEFIAEGKLQVVNADGRQASLVRPHLEEAAGHGRPLVGIVLSNELLDEFDPARLRLMWRKNRPPSARRCMECQAYREAYVLHSIDARALETLIQGQTVSVEELEIEGRQLFCGLLHTAALKRAMLAVAEDLSEAERWQCAPMAVCCHAFLLAVNQALQFHHEALYQAEIIRREDDGLRELVRLYRAHSEAANGTVPLSKDRYRQLRRLAADRGAEMEKALLTGSNPDLLPGRIKSSEVFLSLNARRCNELKGWMERHASRLAVAAKLRDASAPVYDGIAGAAHTAVHLKLVLRPGEASFVEEAAKLMDDSFLVTLDYGADADALLWHTLIRPSHEGIHIMDARDELFADCTAVSYLACPGLQDLTTSVDFTEVAVAGKQLGDWELKAYGPVFLIELSFDQAGLNIAPAGNPYSLGHLLERAGGLVSAGLQAWYRKPEQDPWASFKIMVQHRGSRGHAWSLGSLGTSWPVGGTPRLFRAPSPCWRRDLSKPPLASLITTATHRSVGDDAWATYASDAAFATDPVAASFAVDRAMVQEMPEESSTVTDALVDQLLAMLLQHHDLSMLLSSQHEAQQQSYADTHLALLLVDYWRLIEKFLEGDMEERLAKVVEMADIRQLPELYGQRQFDRVLNELTAAVFSRNATLALPGTEAYPAYVCLAARALHGRPGLR
eukprot:TRINITY_DN29351_c0_g1_i1.p1 TRINITY_DN29351_c0_g1~~TRINITY_DN29351_c0_g1_i1.p1  ORF type:complete len:831 (+),score=109.74 TRINITY_DN29351_c0_g1_i1:46-2538(+)